MGITLFMETCSLRSPLFNKIDNEQEEYCQQDFREKIGW